MNKPSLPYYFEWSKQFPHIAAADIYGKQTAIEIAVMAIDNRSGDLYFIRLDQLDPIDLRRLRQIILSRDSARYPLWDLMSHKSLPNGMNALEFFQQFVLQRTISGEVLRPGQARSIPVANFGYKGPASAGYNGPDVQAAAAAAPTAQADHDVEYVEIGDGDGDGDGDDNAAVPAPVAVQAKRRVGRPPGKKKA